MMMKTTFSTMSLTLLCACSTSAPGPGADSWPTTSGGTNAEGSAIPGGTTPEDSTNGSNGCDTQQDCGIGEQCTEDNECSSGYCTNGVCCDLPCIGTCQTCTLNLGTCEDVPAGTDPDSECNPGVCGNAQECVSGEFEWVRGYGGPEDDTGSENRDWGSSVAVDPEGRVYVIGSFEGTIEFGGQEYPSRGGRDIFIVSLDPTGSVLWSKHYGTSGHDNGTEIITTPNGEVIAVGVASGDPGFGEGWSTDGSLRGYVIALGKNGDLHGSAVIQSSEISRSMAVASGSDGDIFVAGGFYGELLMGSTRFSTGDEDMFIVQLDESLDHQWSWTHGSPGKDLARGVAAHASGAFALTGYVSSSTQPDSRSSYYDVYIATFSDGPADDPAWDELYESGLGFRDKGHDLEFLPDGDIIATGYFGNQINFGLGPLTSEGNSDIFLARLEGNNGAEVWAKAFGSSEIDVGHRIALDQDEHIIIAGRAAGTVNLGGADLVAEGQDMLVAKFTADGDHLWSRMDGQEGSDYAYGVDTASNGVVYLTGAHTGNSFDDMPLSAAEGTDAFVMKLSR